MNVIYRKDNGDIIDFIEGDVKGLKSSYAINKFYTYIGDKTETNISELDGFMQSVLDAHNIFTKLQIRRGLRALGNEAKLDTLLAASAEFKSDWLDASEIDLNDEMTQQALSQSDIDIDILKKQILGIE